MSTSYLNDKTRSRGLRNNNPLNIRKTSAKWVGKITPSADKDFEQFTTLEYGLRAGAINIKTQINQRGKNTLTKLIYTYAPPNENDTTSYIKSVADSLKITPNSTIKADAATLFALVKSMLKVENGNDANLISDAQIMDGVNLALNIKPKDQQKETNAPGILADAGLFILLLLVFIYFIIKL